MRSRAAWILAVTFLCGVLGVAGARARGPKKRHPRHPARAAITTPPRLPPKAWPHESHALTPVKADFPQGFGVLRVMVDPGHGAPNNRGNRSCFCLDEQDTMFDLAEAVVGRLEATGHIQARLTRDRLHPAGYAIRLADAQAWRAQAFVSLHSDIRGTTRSWKPDGGAECLMAEDAPGFSVLYSVEGDGDLTQRRAALAEAVAKRMLETGFSTYGGAEYSPKYDSGPSKGTFIDRHPEGQRIMVLRQATMPSVIIETHNALDPREAERWTNRDTIDAFASAVTAALVDTLTGQP